jgi:trehalose-phosphatase
MVESLLEWLDRVADDGRDLLVATDFDGTLAEISSTPDDVQLSDRAERALRALTRAPRTHVAIVSGRTLGDLRPRVKSIGKLWLASDHGSFILDPESRAHIPGDGGYEAELRALGDRANEIARLFPGARVDRKLRSVALHYRNVDPIKQETAMRMFRVACIAHRARVLPGRKVVEGCYGRSDKAMALGYITRKLPADAALIYVGDDDTDEPALDLARRTQNGVALFVRSRERPEPRTKVNGCLSGPNEWIETLNALALLRGSCRAA